MRMENQLDKKMDNGLESGMIKGVSGDRAEGAL